MLPLAGGMSDGEDDDLLGGRIDGVIDEVRVFAGDELADAFDFLPPSSLGEQDDVLQGFDDSRAHPQRRSWVALANIVGDVDKGPASRGA